jgi:hypothetical protein
MANQVIFSIDVTTAEGLSATDTNATISLRRLTGDEAFSSDISPFNGTGLVKFDPSSANATLVASVSFDHFQDAEPGIFFANPGQTTTKSFTVLRDSNAWRATFTPLANLGSGFKALTDVIAVSDSVDMKDGTQLGSLQSAFDQLTGISQEFAKMALLNLYAMLSSERNPIRPYAQPWFSFVRKIVRLDRERFVAEVDQPVFDSVQHILNRQDYFNGVGFFPELSPGLHVENFPARYGISGNGDIITVKKQCEEGNLQLTVAVSEVSGQPKTYLLDCDMDEHANLVLHTFDVFLVHPFTGGTNPIDMHEVIVLADSARQMNDVSALDLGYVLRPVP